MVLKGNLYSVRIIFTSCWKQRKRRCWQIQLTDKRLQANKFRWSDGWNLMAYNKNINNENERIPPSDDWVSQSAGITYKVIDAPVEADIEEEMNTQADDVRQEVSNDDDDMDWDTYNQTDGVEEKRLRVNEETGELETDPYKSVIRL